MGCRECEGNARHVTEPFGCPCQPRLEGNSGLATPRDPLPLSHVSRIAGLTRRTHSVEITEELCGSFERDTLIRSTFPDIIARRAPGRQNVESFLYLSMIDALIGTVLRYDPATVRVLNYGIDRARFFRPLLAGSEIWLEFEVAKIRERGAAFLVTYSCEFHTSDASGSIFATVDWIVHLSSRCDEDKQAKEIANV